ncbi:unnamed protein product [Somion occarium]|uniref:rRNA-processing protein EFG1 n=1 Tax=Somion occarium TaxID=3059160 RepID=A0ABP1DUY5_9APHY
MPPVRTTKASSSQSARHPKDISKHKRPFKGQKPDHDPKPQQGLPGVQKIKSALRQTRRLLAKEKLGADVRVETERRLKSLEKDLAEAERIRKERTMSKRYHKKQSEATTDKTERKQLQVELFELRVNLNYIIHYPRNKKYVSLFPPEVRKRTEDDSADSKGKGKEKDDEGSEAQDQAEKAKTDLRREEVKKWIRERMERGEISAEPELEEHRTLDSHRTNETPDGGDHAKEVAKLAGVQEDAFFGDDSDGDEDGDENMEDDS